MSSRPRARVRDHTGDVAATCADADAGTAEVRCRVTVQQAPAAIDAALAPLAALVPELNVYGYRNPNPSRPAIDVYPAPQFQAGGGFGPEDKWVSFLIRARVQPNDPEAAQKTLLRLLDPADPASVEKALYADTGTKDHVFVGTNDFVTGLVDEPDGFWSCSWQVTVEVS